MAVQFVSRRPFLVLAEDPSLVPSTHTVVHNQLQLQGTNALSDILIYQAVCCVCKCIRLPLLHSLFKSVRSNT